MTIPVSPEEFINLNEKKTLLERNEMSEIQCANFKWPHRKDWVSSIVCTIFFFIFRKRHNNIIMKPKWTSRNHKHMASFQHWFEFPFVLLLSLSKSQEESVWAQCWSLVWFLQIVTLKEWKLSDSCSSSAYRENTECHFQGKYAAVLLSLRVF